MCRCPHPEHPDPAAGPGTSVCFPPLLHDASVTLPHWCLLHVPSVSPVLALRSHCSQKPREGVGTAHAPGLQVAALTSGVLVLLQTRALARGGRLSV